MRFFTILNETGCTLVLKTSVRLIHMFKLVGSPMWEKVFVQMYCIVLSKIVFCQKADIDLTMRGNRETIVFCKSLPEMG